VYIIAQNHALNRVNSLIAYCTQEAKPRFILCAANKPGASEYGGSVGEIEALSTGMGTQE